MYALMAISFVKKVTLPFIFHLEAKLAPRATMQQEDTCGHEAGSSVLWHRGSMKYVDAQASWAATMSALRPWVIPFSLLDD